MDGNLDGLLENLGKALGDDSLVSRSKTTSKRVAPYSPLVQTTGDKRIDDLYDTFGRKHDVDPNLLWAQGHQESTFKNNALSPKGARGIAQFMPATAAEFGVNVNDPASSINGQAVLMRKLLDRTGDVELSLAGYNSGHNLGAERLRRNRQRIPETRDYVNRITKNYFGSSRGSGNVNNSSDDLSGLLDNLDSALSDNVQPKTDDDFLGNLLGALGDDSPNADTSSAPSPSPTFPTPVPPEIDPNLPIGGIKQPLIIADETGNRYTEAARTPDLKPNEIRVRQMGREKAPLMIATAQMDATGKVTGYTMRSKNENQSASQNLPKDYLEFIKAREIPDSQDARNEYSNLLKDAPSSFETVKQPSNKIVQQTSAIQPNQQPKTVLQSNENPAQAPETLAPGTYDNLQNSTASRTFVDLSKKPAGVRTNQYLLAEGLKQANLGLTDEQINKYVSQNADANINDFYDNLQDKDLPATLEALKKNYGDTNVEMSIPQRIVDDIKGKQIQSVQSLVDPQADKEAQLLAQAKDNIYNSPLSGGTEAEVQAEFERLKRFQLSDNTQNIIGALGTLSKERPTPREMGGVNSDFGSGVVSSLIGDTADFLGGFARFGTSLGILPEGVYRNLNQIGQGARIFENSAKTNTKQGDVLNFLGHTAVDVPKFIGLSAIPGGAYIAMGIEAGAKTAGRGGNLTEIASQTAQGLINQALFHAAPRIGKLVENGAVGALPKGNLAEVTGKLLNGATQLGVVGDGTFTTSKLFGNSDEESFKNAVLTTLMHAAMQGGKVRDLAGKYFRMTDGKRSEVITVAPDKKVLLLKEGLPKEAIDADFDLSKVKDVELDKNGVYRASGDNSPIENRNPEIRDLRIGETAPPRELSAENPRRAVSPDPQAQADLLKADSRVQKIENAVNENGNQPLSAEAIAKKTRFNQSTVEDVLLKMYAARRVEILPDQTVRLISDNAVTNEGLKRAKTLYDRAQEIDASKPQEPIGLQPSSIESEIGSSDSTKNNQPVRETFEPRPDAPDVIAPRSNITPETVRESVYENLPEQKLQEAAPEKPVAQVTYNERENTADKLNVFTERGTKASIEPKVIDTSDLLTSLDEGYPSELQPRDRSRAASKAQISEIANKLNPDFLGDSPKASDGRPLTVPVKMPDGSTKYAVISGNGRSEGIKGAYELGKADDYRSFAKSKDPKSNHKQPVYVGILDPNEISNLPEYAKEANESATAQMSATEQAKSDAERLDSDAINLFVPSDDGSIHGAANRDFTRAFLQRAVPTSEQGRLVDADGKLNQDGAVRVRNAIFARAFGDSESGLNAISRMSESTDNNVRNITNGLLAKAGQIAVLKEAAKNGTRHKEFDVSADLGIAMEKYAALKESGTSLDDYIQQGNLFGAETTPFQTRVMQVFDDHKRSAKAVRTIIGNFLDIAEAAGDPNQKNLFGEKQEIDIKSAFEAAVEKYENSIESGNEPNQAGLFGAENQGVPVRRGAEAAVFEDARPASTEADALGQNRLDVPPYSLPSNDLPANRQYESLVNDLTTRAENFSALKYGDEKAAFNKKRIAGARVIRAGNLMFANPDAMELLRQAHNIAFQLGNSDVFLGTYQNPRHTQMVRDALQHGVLGGAQEISIRLKAREILKIYDEATHFSGFGDVRILAVNKDAPRGLEIARQEETAHQADYRYGAKHSISKQVVPSTKEGKLMMREVANDYKNVGSDVIAMEVGAKVWRDDAETELNAKSEHVNIIRKNIIDGMVDANIDFDALEKAFSEVSGSAREFVKDYGKQREEEISSEGSIRNAEGQNSGRTEPVYLDRKSGAEIRERNRSEGARSIQRESAGNGAGFLEPARSGNEIAAYARPTLVRKALEGLDKVLSSKDYLSSTKAVEAVVSKNLQQLRQIDEDAYEQILKLAGTASQVTVEALHGAGISANFAHALAKQNFDDVVSTLQVAGLAIPLKKGVPTPTEVAGKTASVIRIGDNPYAVPRWLADELKPVLDHPSENIIQKAMGKLNAIGMAGPLDAYFHSLNLVGTIIGGTPYVGTDIISRTIGNTPVTKWLTGIVQLATTNPVDPSNASILREMAEAGVIPSRYGRETFSKKYAALLAAEVNRHSFGPVLNGPKGIDIRARMLMWKIGKHINPKASNADMADFVNQLGIYNRMMESQLARAMKSTNIAPFFTAGSTIPKNAALMWLGKSPIPNDGISRGGRAAIRAQQLFSGGPLGLLALWVGAYLLYRGMLPWKDKESRFMQIPLNEDHRRSALGKTIWGDNDKTAYVGLGFFSPLVERGAKALGISGAYDEAMLGGNKTQMFESGLTGIINTALHPVSSGPVTKAVVVGVTGNEPTLSSLRDKNGNYAPSLWENKELPKNAGAGRTAFEGILELNPMLGGILHGLGVNRDDKKPDEITGGEGKTYFKSILDIVLPRLAKNESDRTKAAQIVEQQKKAIEKNESGEKSTGPKTVEEFQTQAEIIRNSLPADSSFEQRVEAAKKLTNLERQLNKNLKKVAENMPTSEGQNTIRPFADMPKKRDFTYEEIDPRFDLQFDPGWSYGSKTDYIIEKSGETARRKRSETNDLMAETNAANTPMNSYRQSENVEDIREGVESPFEKRTREFFDWLTKPNVRVSAERSHEESQAIKEAREKARKEYEREQAKKQRLEYEKSVASITYESESALIKRATDTQTIIEIMDNAPERIYAKLMNLAKNKAKNGSTVTERRKYQEAVDYFK